jgi:hypothetical protein
MIKASNRHKSGIQQLCGAWYAGIMKLAVTNINYITSLDHKIQE